MCSASYKDNNKKGKSVDHRGSASDQCKIPNACVAVKHVYNRIVQPLHGSMPNMRQKWCRYPVVIAMLEASASVNLTFLGGDWSSDLNLTPEPQPRC